MAKIHCMRKDSDQVLSLFSGAGGFSYGFSRAGLRPVCGVEISAAACETYELNVGSPCHNLDLSAVEPEFFRREFGGGSPFAIIGGPPCQGFSTAGPRRSDDPRNKLIFNYLRIVASLQPKWFIFENVEGLLTSGGGRDVAELLREFLGLGYSVRLEKVNLAKYGVPQTRKRVLIVGNRLGLDFLLPSAEYTFDSGKAKSNLGRTSAPTVEQALCGLGPAAEERGARVKYANSDPHSQYDSAMRGGNAHDSVTEHWSKTSSADKAIYRRLDMGGTMKDLPEEFWHQSYKRRAFRRVMDGVPTEKRGGAPSGFKRLHADRQSLTITGAATREFIHPYMDRPLTPRECARLQSFPDHYSFTGNAAAVIQQIGNAVPPLASEILAEHLKCIDGRIGSGQPIECSKPPSLLGFVLTDSAGKSGALKKTENLLLGLMQKELQF